MSFAGRVLKRLRRSLVGWPAHPIDAAYGIATSAEISKRRLGITDVDLRRGNNGYVGSQPSIIRASIRELPDVDGATFMDIGCGKEGPSPSPPSFPSPGSWALSCRPGWRTWRGPTWRRSRATIPPARQPKS